MKKVFLIISFFISVFVNAQTPQTSYVVTSIAAMKTYFGNANRIHVTATNEDYVSCPSCTADEITIYAGAGSRKWKKVIDDLKLTKYLTSGYFFVGNGSSIATGVAMSGDVTIDNTGLTAIGASKVTNAMLAGSIADDKISSAATWNAKQSAITTGTTAQYFRGDLSLATFPTGLALTANPLSQFAATTSAQLAGVISDETGTDKLVFNTSPSFAGTPSLKESGGVVELEFRAIGATTYYNTLIGKSAGAALVAGFYAGGGYNSGMKNTIVGNGAGALLVSGNENTIVGQLAGGNLTGTGDPNTSAALNTLIGSSAGGNLTFGSSNTCIGQKAGIGLTTGSANLMIGKSCASANVTGAANLWIGNTAGEFATTTGTYNTVVGTGAGQYMTGSGVNNVFIGGFAGAATNGANNTASNNVGIGKDALLIITSGVQNVAIGYQALKGNTTAAGNVAIGYQAGLVNNGGENVYIGGAAGLLHTGARCIFLGYSAGNTVPITSQNIFVAGGTSNDRIDEVFFGKGYADITPTAYTINGTGGSGTDIAGADIQIAGGKGTGNAAGGAIIFKTSTAGASSSTLQTLAEKWRIGVNGNLSNTGSAGTGYIHLKAGTATANTAPLKFTSGTLLTTAEAGAVEFLTDAYYGTITTGAARRRFTQSIDNTLGTLGTATNDAATAGNVGEEVNAVVSTYTNYTTTATYQNITSITLTAGDWDLSAFMTYSSNAATITAASNAIFVISTTTASAAGATEGKNIAYVPQAALLGTSLFSESISPYRVSISGSTTYYLNTQATFTLGNPQYVGGIRARRLR